MWILRSGVTDVRMGGRLYGSICSERKSVNGKATLTGGSATDSTVERANSSCHFPAAGKGATLIYVPQSRRPANVTQLPSHPRRTLQLPAPWTRIHLSTIFCVPRGVQMKKTAPNVTQAETDTLSSPVSHVPTARFYIPPTCQSRYRLPCTSSS